MQCTPAGEPVLRGTGRHRRSQRALQNSPIQPARNHQIYSARRMLQHAQVHTITWLQPPADPDGELIVHDAHNRGTFSIIVSGVKSPPQGHSVLELPSGEATAHYGDPW